METKEFLLELEKSILRGISQTPKQKRELREAEKGFRELAKAVINESVVALEDRRKYA